MFVQKEIVRERGGGQQQDENETFRWNLEPPPFSEEKRPPPQTRDGFFLAAPSRARLRSGQKLERRNSRAGTILQEILVSVQTESDMVSNRQLFSESQEWFFFESETEQEINDCFFCRTLLFLTLWGSDSDFSLKAKGLSPC